MSTSRDHFIQAVQDSLLLTEAQKTELLDKPELLPEPYCEEIIRILSAYNARAKARVQRVEDTLDTLTVQQ
jgi:hypothetical protein